MIYTIPEVANKLNVSKVTIYNKLKLTQFKDKTVTKQGQTMIDDDLLNLIKDSLKLTNRFINDDNIEPQEATGEEEKPQDVILDTDLLSLNKDYIDYLKAENERLWNELSIKDIQIQELNNRLSQEQKLVENSQILLRDKPQEIKLLEHFNNLDEKLINIKEQMEQRKNQWEQDQQQPKGLFQRIFNK